MAREHRQNAIQCLIEINNEIHEANFLFYIFGTMSIKPCGHDIGDQVKGQGQFGHSVY